MAAATRTTSRPGISSTVSPGHARRGLRPRNGWKSVGTPAPVVDGVATTDHAAVDVAVTANGSLIYVPGGAGDRQTVVFVDRQGRASPLPGLPPGSYLDVRVSPDGARLARRDRRDVWTVRCRRAPR